jgi:HAD superfamily phosphatase (TIGR01668 family)
MIHLLLRTKKFIPNEFHNSFFDINFKELYNNGLRLVLTDLDNTLISYDENKPTKNIIDKFEEIERIGFEVIVISNNVSSRINEFLEGTKYKGVGNARKPLLIGLRKALRLAEKDYSHKETVIIGDQLMTDVYCANRFNSYSILVNPLKKKTEKWYTKMNRRTEVKMLKKIERKYNDKFNKLSLDERH